MVELTDDDEDDSALDVAQVRRALLRTAVAAPLLGLLHVGLVESFSAYAVVRSTCRVLPLLPLALAERPVSGCRTAGRELAVLAAWSGLVVWCLGSDVLGDYVWNVLYSGSPTLAARQTAKDAAGLIEPWLNMPPLVMVLSLAAMGTPLAVAFSARVARLSLRWQVGYAVLASLVVGGLAVQEWMAHWLLFRPWGNTPNVTRGTARGLTLFVPLAAAGIVLTAAAVDRLDARLFGPRATPEPPHAPPAGRRLALMALILGAGLVVLGRAIAV